MLHHSLSLPVAGILGLGTFEVVVIFIVLALAIALPVMIIAITFEFKNRQQKLWHETARLALEKGQPLPAQPASGFHDRTDSKGGRNDIRTGLILIAVGVGLAVFFKTVGARDAMGIGAIPGFIGVALLLFGLFSPRSSPNENQPPKT